MIWGTDKVLLGLRSIQALKLKWCLKDLEGLGTGGKVVEIGCGAGGMVKAIKHYRPDLEVIGVDIDKKAIEAAKKNDKGVKFMVGNGTKLGFKSGSMDGVVSFDVLEHVEGYKKVIKEVYRVLKAGGVFHNFVPLEGQAGSIYWWLKFLGWKGKKMAGHINVFDDKRLIKDLKEAGFRIGLKKFGNHGCYQLLDMVHHTSWQALKKRPVKQRSLFLMKQIVAPLFYFESWLFQNVPGGAVSLGAVK